MDSQQLDGVRTRIPTHGIRPQSSSVYYYLYDVTLDFIAKQAYILATAPVAASNWDRRQCWVSIILYFIVLTNDLFGLCHSPPTVSSGLTEPFQ